MIGKKLGRYDIVEKIGAGGMGEVYRARDLRLERDVALKVLSPRAVADESGRKRFRKEALVLSKLNHRNIATILDYDAQDGTDFLVMEYIVGATLADKLSQSRLTEKEMLAFAIQIAEALQEAHEIGIVHRDLKPNNIMLTPKAQVKVLDFGLAKLMRPANADLATRATTETNLVVGTMPYMSPEQLRGQTLDARTDIYSFGVVLYEMSTGKRPHLETQPITLAEAILYKVPTSPVQLRPDLSPGLQEIILKCLEKEPENRYQSAKELLVALNELATPSLTISVPRSQLSSPAAASTTKIPKSNWKRLTIASVFVLIAAAAALLFFQRTRTTPPASLVQIQTVVALPTRVYGPDENRFLTDAIPNGLSTYLSQLEGLETKVPPTSVEVERVGGDLKKLAEIYGAHALISSSVTSTANDFVLTVQVVEPDNRRLRWSREYKGRHENYLDLVRTAAEGLRSALRPDAAPIRLQTEKTQSADAELLYQRGVYHLRAYANRKQTADFDSALSNLNQAIEMDPNLAAAAGAIARLYVSKLEAGAPLREVLPEMDRWSRTALQLDHRSGEAWQVQSIAEEMRPDGDKRKRLEYALKAATYASQSGYSHQVLASALAPNSLVLAAEAARESIRREPLHLNGMLFAAGMFTRQGKTKEGLELIDRVLSMEPDMPVAVIMKHLLLLRNHEFEKAEKLMGRLEQMAVQRRMHPGWVGFARDWFDFENNRARNNSSEAANSLARLVGLARGEAPPFPRWEMMTGNVVSIQAENDSAQATLETLALREQKGIFEPYDFLLLSPELQQIKKDPRFNDLAARSRREFEQMLTSLDQARQRNELPPYLDKPLLAVRRLL